jgi:K+ transporter
MLGGSRDRHRSGDRADLCTFLNWALGAGTITAVIGFGSSDALAGAFGIAVSPLMAITTMTAIVALHLGVNFASRMTASALSWAGLHDFRHQTLSLIRFEWW